MAVASLSCLIPTAHRSSPVRAILFPTADGNLVNTAGYYLQGFDLSSGSPSVVANALTGLERVNINQSQLEANATTKGSMSGNLPAQCQTLKSASLPSANDGTISNINYTAKTSLVSLR